jgi:V8-like Glu-specific endopeptidase
MKLLIAFAIVAALAAPAKKADTPTPEAPKNLTAVVDEPITKAHGATLQIGQQIISEQKICSATAIGPHAVLTATHCEVASDYLAIREGEGDYKILGRIRDGNDHTIYLVSGAAFKDFAPVVLTDPLAINEDVFTFGNPGEWEDIFQRGYIAGTQADHSVAAALAGGSPDTILFSVQAYKGESGAAVFNSAGQVIAVISFDDLQIDKDDGERIGFAAALRFAFTQADIDKAAAFAGQ